MYSMTCHLPITIAKKYSPTWWTRWNVSCSVMWYVSETRLWQMTNWVVIAAQVAGGRTDMTCRLSPVGFTEVMFRMHVLWCLMFLPRQISNNGMSSNDQGSHTRLTLQHELSLSSCLPPPSDFFSICQIQNSTHTTLSSQSYSRPCGWC